MKKVGDKSMRKYIKVEPIKEQVMQILAKLINQTKDLNQALYLIQKRISSVQRTSRMIGINQLLQLYNQYGNLAQGILPNKYTKFSIPHGFIASQAQLSSYSNQVKNIYEHIFVQETDTDQNKKALIKLEEVLLFQPKQTPMPVCNKILNRSEPVFRCYDCMTHESAVLCKSCFQDANHKGHRYIQINSGGGNCDCGNPDAINPTGFCTHHPGKAEPVEICPQQDKHFTQIFAIIFEWIFRLYEKDRFKSADLLGQMISDFLLKRNEKSLYYNTLTYRLIFGYRIFGQNQQKREQKIIDKIFHYGIKLVNFAHKMTDIFLNMFSLEVLKYELTISYTIAYNKIEGFEKSKFKSLYIQLFANNQIIDKMLTETKLVLYPQNKNYNDREYIENLSFLGSIKEDVAEKYFVLLNQKGYIKYCALDTIQQQVEHGTEHIVNFINNDLDKENYYYVLMGTVVSLFKNNPTSLVQMLTNYIDAVMESKYSYMKNKVVMPYHKTIAMILSAIFKANIEQINGQMIQKMIDFKYKAKDVFTKIFQLILSCWKQFAKTFYQTSYFDNYIPLYIKSGCTIVIYDLLMFSICTKILQESLPESQLNEILFAFFQIQFSKQSKKDPQKPLIQEQKLEKKLQPSFNPIEMQNEVNDDWADHDSQMDEEYMQNSMQKKQQPINILKKNVQLIKIMIESCISERSQILVANTVKIKDQKLQYRTQKLFVEAMNNFKEISTQNLQLLSKNFIQSKNIENQIIKQFLTFDKTKKKYTLNEMKDQRFSSNKIPLFLYPTMKKFGGIFAQETKDSIQNLLLPIILEKQRVKKLKFLFNQKFVSQISIQFLKQLTSPQKLKNKETLQVFLDFLDLLKTLQYLMRQQAPKCIYEFYQQVAQLSLKEEFSFLSEKLARKHSEDLLQKDKLSAKMKFQEKKKKKLEQMKKMQQSYAALLDDFKEQKKESESICLICREDEGEGLCLLSNFSYSNILQSFNQAEGRNLVFDSCFHPIHMKCFLKTSKHQTLPCPLCKCLSNIMLPFEKQFNEEQTIFEIFDRISTLKVVMTEQYVGYDKKLEESGILSIFRSISSMIGKNLLKGDPILDEKDQRIANILYGMVKTIALSGTKEYELKAQQIQKFFQVSRQKAKQIKIQTTNLYAMQYIIVKILYGCFTQNHSLCISVLSQPQAKLINKKDLKKIWLMCNQIVSLPIVEISQEESAVNEMKTVIDIYVPPENVFDLIQLRDSFQMSCKNGHQMCICLSCKVKCCYDCKQTKKHFRDEHCGEGLAFNVLTGGLVYVWEERLVQTPSLYCNQMGFEWKPSKSPDGYHLDKETYEQVKKSILDEKISKYLMKKYPDILKKGVLMDMNLEML